MALSTDSVSINYAQVNVTTIVPTSGSIGVNLDSGTYIITPTMDGATTWTFTTSAPSTHAVEFMMVLTCDAIGAASQDFPGVLWPGGTVPSMSTGTDVLKFVINNGTIIGLRVGIDIS